MPLPSFADFAYPYIQTHFWSPNPNIPQLCLACGLIGFGLESEPHQPTID